MPPLSPATLAALRLSPSALASLDRAIADGSGRAFCFGYIEGIANAPSAFGDDALPMIAAMCAVSNALKCACNEGV